jgi:hypothetical protein
MRLRTILALAGVAAILGGCVYDPYTGTYVPCCNYYGYPYGYAYPRPYYRPAPSSGAVWWSATRAIWRTATWPAGCRQASATAWRFAVLVE